MSSEGGDPRTAMEGNVDYKTLFLGSCTVIVLLSGAAFRLWDSTAQRDLEQAARGTHELERKIAVLEAGYIEYRFQIAQLQQEHKDLKTGHDAQNRAIYSLERHYVPLERTR